MPEAGAPAPQDVVVERVDGHVGTITLNRPEQGNAFTSAMGTQLNRAFNRLDADDRVRCIVLTGAGRQFCVGLDLSAGAQTFEPDGGLPASRDDERLEPPSRLRTPVIAAVNGHAVGVGITLAMQCDLRVVSEDAKLGFSFVRRGIVPEFYAHWTVQRVAGFARAAELFLTGRTVPGADALSWGLANRVTPATDVLDTAMALAREIAESGSPAAVAATKELLWAAAHSDLDSTYDAEAATIRWLTSGPDVAEGIRSFLEKRPPEWSTSTSDRRPVQPEGGR